MKTLLTLFIALFSLSASAYTILSLRPVDLTKAKSVDIFVVGYGKEMGTLFLNGAITRARYHQEIYPTSRAQIILWAKENSKKDDISTIQRRNLNIIKANSRKLSMKVIGKYLANLETPISSLHVFSHNNGFAGSSIQKGKKKLNSESIDWASLSSSFTTDSYVILHGCNTGFKIAPNISKLLKRPVFGSLTSTDFQKVFDGGDWFFNNDYNIPEGRTASKWNTYLFSEKEACWKGYCNRMMPNNHPYRGTWGSYDVGLPFYKGFCNYDGANKSCENGIVRAVESWPNLNGNTIEDKLLDFICPIEKDPRYRNDCINFIKNGVQSKFFRGKTLNCNLKGCDFKVDDQAFVGSDAGMNVFKAEYEFLLKLFNK